MNTDEICELLLRLPPGAALVLPADVERQAIENAIKKATAKNPALEFATGEQLAPATSVGPPRRYPRIVRQMKPREG